MKLFRCLMFSLLCAGALAQTPIRLSLRDLTGSPLNRTVTFTSMDVPLVYGTNVIYSDPLTVIPVNGLIETNLYTGNYRITLSGMGKAFTKYVPDSTETIDLADPQYTTTGLVQVFTIHETNSVDSVTNNDTRNIQLPNASVGRLNGKPEDELSVAAAAGLSSVGGLVLYESEGEVISEEPVVAPGFEGDGSLLTEVNASTLGGSAPDDFVKTTSDLLITPDQQTIEVDGSIVSTPASIPSAQLTLLNTNLATVFASSPFLTTNRIYFGSVESLQDWQLQGAYSSVTGMTLPTFPEVQISSDNSNWVNAYVTNGPVYVSLYDASGNNDGGTNLLLTGFERPFTRAKTNDWNAQYIFLDMLTEDPRQAVNMDGATNLVRRLLPEWSEHPARTAVNLDGEVLNYNSLWRSTQTTNVDGSLSALTFQYNGTDIFKLRPVPLDFGTNAAIVALTIQDTNVTLKIYSANASVSPSVTYSTNLSTWATLTQTTNYYDNGFWFVESTAPSTTAAFYRAYNAANTNLASVAVASLNAALRLEMQTVAPTASVIGGTSTKTNIVLINLNGTLKKYWSNGTTVWSADL